jgi:invasion protein IalB
MFPYSTTKAVLVAEGSFASLSAASVQAAKSPGKKTNLKEVHNDWIDMI